MTAVQHFEAVSTPELIVDGAGRLRPDRLLRRTGVGRLLPPMVARPASPLLGPDLQPRRRVQLVDNAEPDDYGLRVDELLSGRAQRSTVRPLRLSCAPVAPPSISPLIDRQALTTATNYNVYDLYCAWLTSHNIF